MINLKEVVLQQAVIRSGILPVLPKFAVTNADGSNFTLIPALVSSQDGRLYRLVSVLWLCRHRIYPLVFHLGPRLLH